MRTQGAPREEDEADGFAATVVGRRITRLLTFMKQGIFGLLYLIAKDQHSSNSIVVATTAVNTLQLLYMSFSERARFPWHWWLTKYLEPFLKFFSLAFVQDLSKPVQIVSFFTFFMMLFFTSAMAALVLSEFASGGVKNLWVLPVLRFMLRLLTTVFYVPVITVLLESLSCDNPFNDILVCGSAAHNGFSAGLLVLLLWFISFSGFIVLVFGQRDPSVGDAEAGPHKRLEFVNSLIRALLEFCFQGLAATQGALTNPNVPYLIAIVNVTGFWLTCSYVYYLPYYSNFTNKVMASFYSVYWWSGICLIAAYAVGDTYDLSSILLFFFGAPPFMYSWALAVDLRVEWYRRTKDRPRDSPYMEEVRLRLKYPLNAVRDHAAKEDLVDEAESIDELEEDDVAPKDPLLGSASLAAMEEYLRVAERFRRDGFFCLHASLLMDRIWHHQVLSRKFLKVAESLPLSFDHLFVVYQKTLQNKERETGAKGAISYLAFDHHAKQAKQAMAESVDLIVEFWSTLMDGNFTVKDLHALSVSVHRTLTRCRLHMRSLLSLNPNSPTALTLYAIYHEYVLNDGSMTKSILGTDDGITGEALVNRLLQIEDVKESEFIVCGEGAQMGKITWSSFGLASMVGFSQAELYHKPIAKLFVPSIADVMSLYLAETVQNISTFAVIKLRTFCQSKVGHCAFVELALTPAINNAGILEFVCRFSEVAEEHLLLRDDLKTGFLLINIKGYIISGNASVWGIVDLDPLEVQARKEHISSVVPWIRNEKSIRAAQHTSKISHAVDLGGTSYHVDVVGHVFASASDLPQFSEVEIFQLKFTELKAIGKGSTDKEVPIKLRHMSSLRSDTFNSLLSETFADEFDMDASQASSDIASEDDFDFDEEGLMRHIRKVIEQRINTSSPMAKRFVMQSRWITLAVIAFFIGSSMLLEVQLEGYRKSLAYSRAVDERDRLLIQLASLAQDQVAAAALAETRVGDEALNQILADNALSIKETALGLRAQHRLLMDVSDATESSRLSKLKFEPNVSSSAALVLDIDNGMGLLAFNPWLGVLELVNHGLAFSLHESPACSTSCEFVLSNAVPTLLSKTEVETKQWYERQTAKLKEISTFSWRIFVAFSVAMVFLMIDVYFPILLATNKSRKYTVHAFATIPSLLVLEMSDMYALRAEQLVKLTEQISAEEGESLLKKSASTNHQVQRATRGPSMVAWGLVPVKRALVSMGSSIRSIEKVTNDHVLVRIAANILLFVRVAYPPFLVWGLSLFFVAYSRETDLIPIQKTADLVGRRWRATAELTYWLKEPPRDGLVDTVSELLDTVSSLTYMLHVGNGSDAFEQLADQQEEQWDLLFEDVCLSRVSEELLCNSNSSELREWTFLNGTLVNATAASLVYDLGLKNGLHFANEQFTSLVRNIRDLHERIEQGGDTLSADLRTLQDQQSLMYRPSMLFESFLIAHQLSTDLAYEYVASAVDTFDHYRFSVSIAVCAVATFAHFLVCRTVSAVDSDTQKNLILLMMLPEKVFKQRPQILDLLQVEQMDAS